VSPVTVASMLADLWIPDRKIEKLCPRIAGFLIYRQEDANASRD
jgi:hypothetical protein